MSYNKFRCHTRAVKAARFALHGPVIREDDSETMSASKAKKKRQELQASGELPQNEGKRKQRKKVLAWIIGIVIAVVLIGLIVYISLFANGYFERHTTALTIGEHEVAPVTYNYFFSTTYQQTASQYGDLF